MITAFFSKAVCCRVLSLPVCLWQLKVYFDSFTGSVSLAGAQPGLWSIKGGNRKVPEGLLRESKARLIQERVTDIINATSNSTQPLYRLVTSKGYSAEYDAVVLAYPLIEGQQTASFSGFTTDFTKQLPRPFHHTVAQFVEGELNYKYFGYDNNKDLPSAIFPLDDDSFYSSIGIQQTVEGRSPKQPVYKVFSDKPLTKEQFDQLFISRTHTESVSWLAYPQYSPAMEFVPVVIAPNLYYVNAIELAASAMEMSAVAGVNVANLIVNQWMQHDHLIDNMFVIEEKHIKIEL